MSAYPTGCQSSQLHLDAQLLAQVIGESHSTLADLLMLTPEQRSHDQLRQLLKQAYPLCSGEPVLYSFAELADLTHLEGCRWSVVCLLMPDLTPDFDKPALTRLLARLRDLHADRVVHVEFNAAKSPDPDLQCWSMADSLALGFSRYTYPPGTGGQDSALQSPGSDIPGPEIPGSGIPGSALSKLDNPKLDNPKPGYPELTIYEYDIRTYKPAPDWLNAQHWANPDMWEKHRW